MNHVRDGHVDGRSFPQWMVDDLAASGIPPRVARERGWRHVLPGQLPAILGFRPPDAPDGYAIPFPDPVNGGTMAYDGGRPYVRVRFRNKLRRGGKYRTPKGAGIRCYVLPEVHAHLLASPSAPLYVTEGEKKALCATTRGLPMVGVTGIYCWKAGRHDDRLNPDLIPYVANRRVFLIYDPDATESEKKARTFADCARRFALSLRPHGAVLYRVDLPRSE